MDRLFFIPGWPRLFVPLSPLLAEPLASVQNTQGYLIIKLSKTLFGKLHPCAPVCMREHTWILSWLSGRVASLFIFLDSRSSPLEEASTGWLLPVNPWGLWGLAPPGMGVEVFVSCAGIMHTRSPWPWPWSGASICDQEKVECLCLRSVLCPAVSREYFIGLVDGPRLQELSQLFSQQF